MKPLLFTALVLSSVHGAPYVVTNYVELSITTIVDSPGETLTELATETVDPPTTPFSALQTSTESFEFGDLTFIDIVLPSGIGRQITTDSSAALQTTYVVPITYTPSASCNQHWSYSTNVPLSVPYQVQIPAATISTAVSAVSTDAWGYIYPVPTPTTVVIAVVNPTNVDTGDLAAASAGSEPEGLDLCYTPSSYCAASPTCAPVFVPTFIPNSGSGPDPAPTHDDGGDSYWTRYMIIKVIVIPVWILLWFSLGLVQSWISFKGVMQGRQGRRGLPIQWCCVSLLFLCCVGPVYKAKSPEEQEVLLERWNAMTKGEKFKLWLKWGFRWKYPNMLGEEPELVRGPLIGCCR